MRRSGSRIPETQLRGWTVKRISGSGVWSLALLLVVSVTQAAHGDDLEKLKVRVAELNAAVEALRNQQARFDGNVSFLSRVLAPVGSVVAFSGNVEKIPENWRWCDGSEVSRMEFPQLFAVIETLWGGDGAPLFRLPDLQGRFLRGSDLVADADRRKWRDVDRDRRKDRVGTIVGNRTGSLQEDATRLPNAPFHTQDGSHGHSMGGRFVQLKLGDQSTATLFVAPGSELAVGGSHDHIFVGGDAESRPKNAYVNWIIRVK